MFDSFNNCLIVVRYGFNLVFVVRMVLDVRLNWLYDVKKVQRHPIKNSLHFNSYHKIELWSTKLQVSSKQQNFSSISIKVYLKTLNDLA
jgi:hypothetical protein